eukprot:gene3181-4026_t
MIVKRGIPLMPTTPGEGEGIVGRSVSKEFPPYGHFSGRVASYSPPGSVLDQEIGESYMQPSWHVVYEDGDSEDVSWKELQAILTDPPPILLKENTAKQASAEPTREKVKSLTPGKRKPSVKTPKKSAKQAKLTFSEVPSATDLGTTSKTTSDMIMQEATGDITPRSAAAASRPVAVKRNAVAKVHMETEAPPDKPEADEHAQPARATALPALAQDGGVGLSVWLPMPIEVATRHHTSCRCALCKYSPPGQKKMVSISKGKAKGWYGQSAPHLPERLFGFAAVLALLAAPAHSRVDVSYHRRTQERICGGIGVLKGEYMAIELLAPDKRPRFVEMQSALEAEFTVLVSKAKVAEAKSQMDQARVVSSTSRVKKVKVPEFEWDEEPVWKLPDDLEEYQGDPEDRRGRRTFEQRRKEALVRLEKEQATWRKEQKAKQKRRQLEALQQLTAAAGSAPTQDADEHRAPAIVRDASSDQASVRPAGGTGDGEGAENLQMPESATTQDDPSGSLHAVGAWGREQIGTPEDLLWELEEHTLADVVTNGSQLFGRDWRKKFRKDTRYRGYKTSVPDPGPTGVTEADLPEGGVVKICQGVAKRGKHLTPLPETGAAWEAAAAERKEERERWDAVRQAFAPLEKKRALEQTALGGKAGSSRADLKATTALEDEYAWGFEGKLPPEAKTRQARRARDPHRIASLFMQKLTQTKELGNEEERAGQGQDDDEKKSAAKVCPFGQIAGVAVGSEYIAKAQMAHAGLHTVWSTGMVSQKVQLRSRAGGKKEVSAVPAIVMVGGYSDDADGGEEFVYTGAGGNDGLHTKLQCSDQSWDGKDNKALACSCDLGLPVRVIRGQPVSLAESFSKTIFVYDGLYMVDRYWDEVGTSGYRVCKFLFRRLSGQPRLTSSRVHAAASTRDISQRDGVVIDPATGRPFDLSGGLEPTPVTCFDPRRTAEAEKSRPLAVPLPQGRDGRDPDAAALVERLLKGAPEHLLQRSAAFVYTPSPLYALDAKPRDGRPATKPTIAELAQLNQAGCMAGANGLLMPYDANGRIPAERGPTPLVFEAPEGGPQVCQLSQGIQAPLEVFRSGDERKGWGLRCLRKIHQWEFVCEYTGLIEAVHPVVHPQRTGYKLPWSVGAAANWSAIVHAKSLCMDLSGAVSGAAVR